MAKIIEVRNSTAEFLTFVAANKEDGVQVFYKDETIWATQQAIAAGRWQPARASAGGDDGRREYRTAGE